MFKYAMEKFDTGSVANIAAKAKFAAQVLKDHDSLIETVGKELIKLENEHKEQDEQEICASNEPMQTQSLISDNDKSDFLYI